MFAFTGRTCKRMDFRQWLEMKYLDWQRRQGGRKTVLQFAEYLDVSQQTLSNWLNETRKPQGDNVRKLADKFGLEVYDVLGLERPNADMFYLQSIWDELSPEDRREIMDKARKSAHENENISTAPKKRRTSKT